ncbi:uncharacterized protein PHACADRAFT_266415 [Phanerochaete carnosa HHB-10118-sp]|uniref:Uncharacterized protein n=1 Tax=Phanerochaete carnosa (strain HHB-10118-sp) TaxID=650164 RepID=K5VNS7_PHACS|nr:uncharacterized protein PHACADRAFT_266415 [Phanerochaete carnosa HHB-10118-sp]EKM48345.1 hypothetical protein PHACADRAFT_266415 [Phanerochaete carnosa HHB-10118-sp]
MTDMQLPLVACLSIVAVAPRPSPKNLLCMKLKRKPEEPSSLQASVLPTLGALYQTIDNMSSDTSAELISELYEA